MQKDKIPRYDEFASQVARDLVEWAYEILYTEAMEKEKRKEARQNALTIRRVADRVEHRYRTWPCNDRLIAMPESVIDREMRDLYWR